MTAIVVQIAEAGRRAFPGVELPEAAIAASRVTEVRDATAAEVYLALACGHGDTRALAYFESAYAGELAKFIAAKSSNRAHVDEVLQRLRATALAPRQTRDGKRPPEILGYTGAGPLLAWLRIAALRILMRLEKAERRHVAIADEPPPRIADPARALERRTSSEAFRRALGAAWRRLDAEDRLRLRVRYADGHGIDHVARVEGVHRATAARRLLRAEERLVTGAREILRETLQLSEVELDSVLRGLHSQHDVTLGSLFRDDAPRP